MWHSVVLSSGAPNPPLQALFANKSHIYRLTIRGCSNHHYLGLTGCYYLTCLNLVNHGFSYGGTDDWVEWSSLVSHHQGTLQHLTVSSYVMIAENFCVAVAGCSRLRTLKLASRLVEPDNGPALWSACLGLHTLQIENTALLPWNSSYVGTSRIERLSIVRPQKGCNGLELLQHCPELRYLYWHDTEPVRLPLLSMGKDMLTTQAWIHLEELNLTLINSKDHDLGMMLAGLTRLVTLHVEKSGFGPISLQAILDKHTSTIKTLNLAMCPNVTSPMIQSILSSMPALEYLATGKIDHLDIIRGSPWVCLQLRHLVMGINLLITGDDEDFFACRQLKVFQQLSTLDRLVILNLIPSLPPSSSMEDGHTLDLRLAAGLGRLSTLKKLESFSFKSNHQRMKLEDAQWMIDSWPRLRKIKGRFATDPDTFYMIKHLFNNHRVHVFD
ncbi:hypothetical protein BGX31_004045 [Mortierella sp. GBA43]|nr:hypothetical protein BGX31_004045 [Mortierella sp. GBA43]